MPILKTLISAEAIRYLANGLFATAVHYAVLRTCLEILLFPSAGLASFVGALFGIAVSFFGSRYFVFQQRSKQVLRQAARFIVLYGFVTCIHACILLFWADLWGLNYTIGFAVAVAVQVCASYPGNKYFVFATSLMS